MSSHQRTRIRALSARAHRQGSSESCELELVRKGHDNVHLRLSATVLEHARATILLAVEDITEHREKERLAANERALRELDRRKDEFLALLSHELRNPLAPISSSLAVLARSPAGSEPARRAQAVIERQVTHLTRLVNDLLDVTRIKRGKIQLHRQAVELGELVRGAMEDAHASYQAKGLTLEGRFEAGSFWVDGDPARLTQLISNLLVNAEKFTPRAGCW